PPPAPPPRRDPPRPRPPSGCAGSLPLPRRRLAAKRFAAELAARFSTVERSGMVWANLPPAYVHRAFEPRRS
ncbi:hypothetical protein K1W54_07050, partial [Micromonospora sp. CPCC 205371]|nr:hypothetical protein [Micromonospora sp. CPCC 205371]